MWPFDYFFGPPNQSRFAKLFMAAMRRAGDKRKMRFEPEEFRIAFEQDGKNSGYSFLQNIYAEYLQAPQEERQKCMSVYVRAALSHLKEMPEDFEDAKPDLRPKIWTRASIEKTRLFAMLEGGKGPDLPYMEIGQHLLLTVVYDLPEAIHSLSRESLSKWGTTFYEALEIAQRNLQEIDVAVASLGTAMHSTATGDSYDGTRLIMLDFIRNLPVTGDVIAMVPNRDNLIVSGSDDPAGLEMMLTWSEKVLEDEPRPMSPVPLRLLGDEWEDWLPEREHPLFERFNKLETMFLYREYAEQKKLLDAIHEKDGTDVFVASFSALERDGQHRSYCIWAKGILSLLPKTHLIAFVRDPGEEKPQLYPWEQVETLLGDRLEKTSEYPARFFVKEFPADELISQLRPMSYD